MIVGTAGHIDHADIADQTITGRDTIVCPKRSSGIRSSSACVCASRCWFNESVLGFVAYRDTKAIHTMLAGATGIDFALLVIAADDGVMPQTDEHLDISCCSASTRERLR